jgi:hypothetical protein
MDYSHISKLLERYFEGETTVEEERTLRRYFTEEPVAEEHRPFAELFRFFAVSRREGYEGEIVPRPAEVKPVKIFRIRPLFWRAAAVVAIAASAWWLYPEQPAHTSSIDWSKYEPATAEEAFQVTSRALRTASAKLNYGARQAAEKVSEVQRAF